jgi:hypothetical protein
VGDGRELVLLMTCADNAEAALIKGLLQSADVHCVVQGEEHRGMLGALGGYIDLRVLVPADELEKAKALLEAEAAEEVPPSPGEHAEDGTPRCPVHHRSSSGPCARCGTFLCDACGEACPTCEENDKVAAAADARPGRRRRNAVLIFGLLFGLPALVILLRAAFG